VKLQIEAIIYIYCDSEVAFIVSSLLPTNIVPLSLNFLK